MTRPANPNIKRQQILVVFGLFLATIGVLAYRYFSRPTLNGFVRSAAADLLTRNVDALADDVVAEDWAKLGYNHAQQVQFLQTIILPKFIDVQSFDYQKANDLNHGLLAEGTMTVHLKNGSKLDIYLPAMLTDHGPALKLKDLYIAAITAQYRIQHPDHPLVAGSLPPLLLGALLADEPKFDQLKFPGFPPDPPQTQFTSIAANIQRLRTLFKAQPLTLNGPTRAG